MEGDLAGTLGPPPGETCALQSFFAGQDDKAGDRCADLAAGLAHNLNNRLEVVVGGVGLAAEDAPVPARSVLLEALLAAEEIAEVVRQLVAFAGAGRFVPVPGDLSQIVRAALARCSLPTNVRLETDLPEDLPPALADNASMERVVANLVANAAEAIGHAPGIIRVRTEEHSLAGERCVCLSVEDTGPGFDPALLDRLYDPFFSTRAPGRGLGLAAVLGIARRHKGAIRTATRPGRGCRFSFYLPAKM